MDGAFCSCAQKRIGIESIKQMVALLIVAPARTMSPLAGTGVGGGGFDLVRDFFLRATPIHYSLETKNTLVLKAQDTIQGRRIK